MRIKDNRLYFGDHFAGDLAKQYGTPLYVYEEEVLRARWSARSMACSWCCSRASTR